MGTYAVRLAAVYGAEVTGVCGPAGADLVRSLGAAHVIDHTREDITDGRHRYDVVVDNAGLRPAAARNPPGPHTTALSSSSARAGAASPAG
ncbi:zinc-binding dehydrogenase [Streptomyces sp. NPDC056716]|uniref:zinc-binding dehydrogenase n=1 Tax=unclassified Streptomyces TaxID=2593676 RepID=UPI00367E21DF